MENMFKTPTALKFVHNNKALIKGIVPVLYLRMAKAFDEQHFRAESCKYNALLEH